jgi:hypothetical protein
MNISPTSTRMMNHLSLFLLCLSILLQTTTSRPTFQAIYLDIVTSSKIQPHQKAILLSYNIPRPINHKNYKTDNQPILSCPNKMRNSSNFSGMEEHYQNILDPLVRKTMKMKLPWPVLIAAYQSAQSDRKKELTCGMFVISYDYHYKDTATIDWTVCSLISNNQKINLVGVTERTVRIMWTGDHIGDPFDKDIVSPMYLPLETSMDVDMSILRWWWAIIIK